MPRQPRLFAFGFFSAALFVASLLTARPAQANVPGANGKIVHACLFLTPDFQQDICLINPDGSGETRLHVFNDQRPADITGEPSFSPDGTKIAFAVTTFEGNATRTDIFVVNTDGSNASNPINLTNAAPQTSYTFPAWSPDGTRIAFNYNATFFTPTQIWLMNADGSNQHVLVALTGPNGGGVNYPAWSPDSTTLVFYAEDFVNPSAPNGGILELFTIHADGTGLKQITFPDTAHFDGGYVTKQNPTWSPDGKRIAFIGECNDVFICPNNDIYTVTPDGTGMARLTHAGDLDNFDFPVWSPDGTKIAFGCNFNPAGGICVMNADGSEITQITQNPDGSTHLDWQRLPSVLVVTDCNDPSLAQLTSLSGGLTLDNLLTCNSVNLVLLGTANGNVDISGDTAATSVNLGSLNSVAGSVTIGGDTSATSINLGALNSVTGSVTITGNTSATSVNLGSLNSVSNNVTITGNSSAASINLGSLNSVPGSVTITGNSSATSVDLGSLNSVSGNVTITGNGSATSVNLGSLNSVGGNLDLTSTGNVSLSGVSTGGNVALTSNGGDSVSGQTGGGTTQVTMLGGAASMTVYLPQNSFSQPVTFTISRLADTSPQGGLTVSGDPATIAPVTAYQFAFTIPTLNQTASLAFTVNLAQLDPATLTALLAAVQNNSATIAVHGDATGSVYQAFALCAAGQAPTAQTPCVAITLYAADGQTPVQDPTQASFIGFTGIAGHFSRYAVVMVSPAKHDTKPPLVSILLTSPNAGIPDGLQGWFRSAPVLGTVLASDVTTGGSAISSLNCGPVPLTTIGLGTPTASGAFSIFNNGATDVSCTATDAAGNTSQPVLVSIKLDATAPTLAPAFSPVPILLHGTSTATPNATDSGGSGMASQACRSLDTSTVGAHTVTCTASDVAGNTATVTPSYTVLYSTSACLGAPGHAVLPPVNADGTSVFKQGSVVPVKLRVCDANGASIGAAGVVRAFTLVSIVNGTAFNGVNAPVTSANADNGFRWDPTAQQWIFNLSTVSLKANSTYVYDVTLDDGSHIGFRFGLK